MKNNILSLATIISVICSIPLCSCNESYISPDYITNDSIHYEEIKDYIPIMLSMSDPHYVTVTKGAGPISAGTSWIKENAVFNVYSFLARNYTYNGDIDYRATFTPEEELPEGEVMKCLIDDPQTGMGAPTKLTDDDILDFINTDITYYYSLRNQDYKYNFFAYYTDDAVIKDGAAKREKDRIYLDINIDGTQDIITAIAKLKEAQRDNIDYDNDKWLYANILNGELVYSALTGHRFIFPIFEASHQLARFNFNLQGEDNMSGNIFIQDIYVKAHRDWRLTVAADNFSNVGLKMNGNEKLEDIHLCDTIGEKDGSKVSLEDKYYNVAENELLENVGMGLLLPPRDSYDLYIKCAFLDNNKWRSYTAKYALNHRYIDEENNKTVNEGFKAGGVYNVTIHVYGYKPIRLEMDGLDWGTPVSIPVDEEKTDVEFYE